MTLQRDDVEMLIHSASVILSDAMDFDAHFNVACSLMHHAVLMCVEAFVDRTKDIVSTPGDIKVWLRKVPTEYQSTSWYQCFDQYKDDLRKWENLYCTAESAVDAMSDIEKVSRACYECMQQLESLH